MTEVRCGTCRYFTDGLGDGNHNHRSTIDAGDCRANPPTLSLLPSEEDELVGKRDVYGYWPRVFKFDYCGQWRSCNE